MDFIAQPLGQVRLGEFLLAHLADPRWTVFRAAVAFVKRSGTQYVRQALQEFSGRAEVRISVGVDLYGTSREGLTDLLASAPGGVFVYRNSGPYTFHPKVYLFKSATHADVLAGSGNLTGGGLFTNYEASLAVSLDLARPEDLEFVHRVEATLDTWSQLKQGVCYALTQEFMERLVTSGLVRSEAELAAMQQARTPPATQPQPLESRPGEAPANGPPADEAPLFIAVPVPAPPRIAGAPAEPAEAETDTEAAESSSAAVVPPPDIIPLQVDGVSSFVMTLQNTDVGVGQTTKGTSRRSPEVFIPLAALDQNPAFWTFPDQFTPDVAWNDAHPENRRNGLGKMDRMRVRMRIGTVQSVRMFFNPWKGDFRLGNEALRSSGGVGDILLVRRVDPVNGFEYDIQTVPQGSPLFQQLAPYCDTAVRNSMKRFGYF